MNENKTKQELKTAVDTMLDLAKAEIWEHINYCMQANNLSPGLMKYVLQDIVLNLTEAQLKTINEELLSLQRTIIGESQKEGAE
ncbi:MAG: hypothetical protein NC548_66225 [Lachnospiraceae bacterium]|nr:hypothetical protein [Lachnospiraceae bacterium]